MVGLENREIELLIYIHIYFYFIAEVMNALVDRRVLGSRNVENHCFIEKSCYTECLERNAHLKKRK